MPADVLAHVAFGYVANVARLTAVAAGSLASAPAVPASAASAREGIGAGAPRVFSVTWCPSPGAASYEVLVRRTTAPTWELVLPIGSPTQYLLDRQNDDEYFGVRAVGTNGFKSLVASMPGPANAGLGRGEQRWPTGCLRRDRPRGKHDRTESRRSRPQPDAGRIRALRGAAGRPDVIPVAPCRIATCSPISSACHRNSCETARCLSGVLIAAASAAGLAGIGIPTVRAGAGDDTVVALLLLDAHMVVHALPQQSMLLFELLAPASADSRKVLEVLARRLVAKEIRSETRARG